MKVQVETTDKTRIWLSQYLIWLLRTRKSILSFNVVCCNYRWSKFITLLMLSMGTNMKINIFGTFPAKGANGKRKKTFSYIFLRSIYKYYFLVLKLKLFTGRSSLTKPRNIFFFVKITNSSFSHCFITNTTLVTFLSCE